jgi:uncharacterized membrane protein
MRVLARLLVVASVAWLGAVIAAPFAIQSSSQSIRDAAAVVYAAAGFICHQRPERSYWIAGEQLPVCARCTGLYVSAAIGGPIAYVYAMALSSARARMAAVAAGLPTLITWSMEMAGLAHPSNTVRAVAALPLGFAVAWLLMSTVRASTERMAPEYTAHAE